MDNGDDILRGEEPAAGQLTVPAPSALRYWQFLSIFGFLGMAGLILAHGADRTPADASKAVVVESFGTPPKTLPETIRVVSFNIHGGKGADGKIDLERIAELIGPCDLAGLYEVRSSMVSADASQATAIGRQLKMTAAFAPTERQWWHDHFGNALLTSMPFESIQKIPLPGTRGKAFRNAILASIPWGHETLRLLAVHIDRQDDRLAQLALMKSLFLSLQPPCLMMGDFNTPIQAPEIQDLIASPGVLCLPQDGQGEDELPNEHVDWIFVRGMKPETALWKMNDASDHPLIEVRLVRQEDGGA